MEDRQPFRVSVTRPDGERHYELRSTTIQLSRGREQIVYFFADAEAAVDPTPQVIETPRDGLTLEGQVAVARALVQLQGFTPEEAATLAARLKARVEGLGLAEGVALAAQIREALGGE
jgi:hypothetical protein